jgi:hypothetical protein
VAFERAWKIDRIRDVDVGHVVVLVVLLVAGHGVVLVLTLGVDGRGFFLVEVWLDV